MESKKKAETFIGFAVRTKRFKIGLNAVATLKKAYIVIVCKTASENTKKEGKKFALKFGCPLYITEERTLEELTFKENAKIMAITDKGISKAIAENCETVLVEEN